MSSARTFVKAAAAVAAAGIMLVAGSSSAQANPSAPYIGDGYTNNTHAVWCVKESLNDFQHGWGPLGVPIPIPVVAQDGIWGPATRQALIDFQYDVYAMGLVETPLATDGVVGPHTGDALNKWGDHYYMGGTGKADGSGEPGYCWQYIPTTP